jgi:creatinine amidohydrolase
LLIWRGCGQHQLDPVVEQFNETHRHSARVTQPELSFHEIWYRIADPNIVGGHADSFSTSIALYLRPSHVRTDRIRDPQSRPVNWDDETLDFTEYSQTGVIGDPTHASRELDERLWEGITDHVAKELQKAATCEI